jgi:hypothetical protein
VNSLELQILVLLSGVPEGGGASLPQRRELARPAKAVLRIDAEGTIPIPMRAVNPGRKTA